MVDNEKWEALLSKIGKCDACYLNNSGGKLFDNGNRSASIMLVDTAPSPLDFEEGRVFSGKKGAFISDILKICGIPESEVYLTYLVKCNSDFSRPPKRIAVTSCLNCLRAQFSLLKPKAVVTLGAISASQLISPDYNPVSRHGEIVEKGKTLFMGTFSPDSFEFFPENKELCFSDFVKLSAKLIK